MSAPACYGLRALLYPLAGAFSALVIGAGSAAAQPVAEFYAGKTITLIISTGSGGGLDASARLIAKHMGNHIPGKPTIVPKNMTGGGHLVATNYLYAQAPKDGTTIGAILAAFVGYQVLDGKGAQYDAAKFHWLGASDVDNQNLYVWHAAGVKSVADAKATEVPMGATGAGSYTILWPTVMNALLGTRFKVVSGYKSTNEIHLAMERGEVQGRAGNFFSSLKSQNADWLADKKINLLVQIGTERDPEFVAVPLLSELAANEEQRRILAFLSGEVGLGKPFLAPPGVPVDRLAALREAFEATTRDRDYLDEAQRLNIGVRAAHHSKLTAIAQSILSTPDDLVAKTREAIAAGK
jgi:tripartite-type tricarboxylate transporter receptor subunit TctC